MAIFKIDGVEVSLEKFSQEVPDFSLNISCTHPLKFPNLRNKITSLLQEAEEHQKVNGRKDEEFPDSQNSDTRENDKNYLGGGISISTNNQWGKKFNKNKPQMSRLFEQFPNALQMIVLASTYGANKYSEVGAWNNFLKVEGSYKTYLDAALRHFSEYENEDESNLPHAALFCWNALAALELFIRDKNINTKDFSEKYLNER